MNYRLMSFVFFILCTSVTFAHAEALTAFLVTSALVGAGTQIGLSLYGANKAEKEHQRTEKLNLRLHEEGVEESKRQFDAGMRQRRKEFGFQKDEAKMDRINNFVWNLSNNLMANKQAQRNFSEILRRRR